MAGDSVVINPGGPGPGGGVSATKTFNGTQRLSTTNIAVQTNTFPMVITLHNSAVQPATIVCLTDDLKLIDDLKLMRPTNSTTPSTAFRVNGNTDNTCGSSVGVSGDNAVITVTGGTVPARSGTINGTCTITVPVRISGDATANSWHRNTLGYSTTAPVGASPNALVTRIGTGPDVTWNGTNMGRKLCARRAECGQKL
ncbi:MAG: hypothetical protein Q4G71_07800 [Pseudomonadota bacterium]|nr:hypothetical protein [Pseudomonadota bacterium]